MSKHIGSRFDGFLAEEGLLEEVSATAIKRVIAWKIAEGMKRQNVNKTQMAALMHTSRNQVDRILDASSTGLTIDTLAKAAAALNFRIRIDLVAA